MNKHAFKCFIEAYQKNPQAFICRRSDFLVSSATIEITPAIEVITYKHFTDDEALDVNSGRLMDVYVYTKSPIEDFLKEDTLDDFGEPEVFPFSNVDIQCYIDFFNTTTSPYYVFQSYDRKFEKISYAIYSNDHKAVSALKSSIAKQLLKDTS